DEVQESLINLFKNGHLPSSVLHEYEDILHLSMTNEHELLEIFANWAYNPGYNYMAKLF
ncbi:31973_t:CDS:1, partial [Gigaspora margarita]